MKKKYLLLLPAISLATSASSLGQVAADVPAAARVNLKAEFTEAKPAKDLYDKLAAMITAKAKEHGEDVDAKAILDTLGLGDITSYAMSSEKDGTEWKNLMFLHNGGSEKGIFSLFGKKGAAFSAPNMCPAGSDLVLQLDLDLKTVEGLIRNFMKVANAPDHDRKDFEDIMKNEVPELDMTTSALLSKLDFRLNLAIDLDNKEVLSIPQVGDFDRPRLVARLDGLAWIWDKVGADLIAESGAPFQKKEANGVTTYTLPKEMAVAIQGYLPTIVIDKNKNQIWIASSSEFLARSMDSKESLATSLAYKGTIKGLPQKGNAMTYMSKDFADLLLRLYGMAKGAGLTNQLGPQAADLEKAAEQLRNVNQGIISTMAKENDGILFSGRSTNSFKDALEEMEKTIEQLKNL